MRVTGVFNHRTFQSENSEKGRHYRRFMDKTLSPGKTPCPLRRQAGCHGARNLNGGRIAGCNLQENGGGVVAFLRAES
jgi:hypothetical protein